MSPATGKPGTNAVRPACKRDVEAEAAAAKTTLLSCIHTKPSLSLSTPVQVGHCLRRGNLSFVLMALFRTGAKRLCFALMSKKYKDKLEEVQRRGTKIMRLRD